MFRKEFHGIRTLLPSYCVRARPLTIPLPYYNHYTATKLPLYHCYPTTLYCTILLCYYTIYTTILIYTTRPHYCASRLYYYTRVLYYWVTLEGVGGWSMDFGAKVTGVTQKPTETTPKLPREIPPARWSQSFAAQLPCVAFSITACIHGRRLVG